MIMTEKWKEKIHKFKNYKYISEMCCNPLNWEVRKRRALIRTAVTRPMTTLEEFQTSDAQIGQSIGLTTISQAHSKGVEKRCSDHRKTKPKFSTCLRNTAVKNNCRILPLTLPPHVETSSWWHIAVRILLFSRESKACQSLWKDAWI